MKTPAEHQPGIERTVVRPRRDEGAEVHLVRDVLDKQIVDPERDPIARVDDVVLAVPEGGGQPWVVLLESGPVVFARRVGRWPGRAVGLVARRWGPNGGVPTRIAWEQVLRIGLEIIVDQDADPSPALATEHWLLNHVTRHLPSLKPQNKDEADEPDPGQEEAEVDASLPPATPSIRALFHRVRLRDVIGIEVHDEHGASAGRIEEVRARLRGRNCIVEEYVLGREGLMERLSVADLSLAALRLLGAWHGVHGRRLTWREMELSREGGRLTARLKKRTL